MSSGQHEFVEYVDAGRDWWRSRSLFGWLSRIRGLVFGVGLPLAGAFGVSLAWKPEWITGVLVIGTALVVSLLFFRHHQLMRISVDERLHSFMHSTRIKAGHVQGATSWSAARERFDALHDHAAQQVAAFYRELLRDKHVNSAIRLAETVDGETCFVTRGRSDGLGPERAQRSAPIPSDKGLALALQRAAVDGVYLVPDIPAATTAGLWWPTPTDKLPEVVRVMAAPITAWLNNREEMIGILYVTSRGRHFSVIDTTMVRAFADFLGLIYPALASDILRVHKE